MKLPNSDAFKKLLRADVLQISKKLLANYDQIDLDAIDGEFYWRMCNPGLPAELDSARDCITTLLARPNQETHDFTMDQLRDKVVALFDKYGLPPTVTINHLSNGDFLSLRGVAISKFDVIRLPEEAFADVGFNDFTIQDGHIVLRVASAGWSGDRVEKQLRSWLAATPFVFGGEADPQVPEPAINPYADLLGYQINEDTSSAPPSRGQSARVMINLTFAQVVEGDMVVDRAGYLDVGIDYTEQRLHVMGGNVRAPYVEITIGLPLPPEGVLAREYDALVRSQGWLTSLAGEATKQDRKTAIRTWTVGLLLAAGFETSDELYRFHEATGVKLVSQAKFLEDRKLLVRRVGEARPFLYARR